MSSKYCYHSGKEWIYSKLLIICVHVKFYSKAQNTLVFSADKVLSTYYSDQFPLPTLSKDTIINVDHSHRFASIWGIVDR